MKIENGYGVVYTPDLLSDFVAELLVKEYKTDEHSANKSEEIIIVDPACGEGSLLSAMERTVDNLLPNRDIHLVGVDVEDDVIAKNCSIFSNIRYSYHCFNSLLPIDNQNAADYWRKKIDNISLLIANPPWSSEKIFKKQLLSAAGYKFDIGQYDSYVLFIELCLKIVKKGGYLAFIIPDSIFASENRYLRKYLAENTELRVIARLGEKIFPGINRATTVLIIKNMRPTDRTHTKCFRLTTEQRKAFLQGTTSLSSSYLSSVHEVRQMRFISNSDYVFDVDTRMEEELMLQKFERNIINWEEVFHFGRGVEVAKSGNIVICPECGSAQGYSKKQANAEKKSCQKCEKEIIISADTVEKIIAHEPNTGFEKIYVGENLQRYSLIGASYIKMGIQGINYKEPKLYEPPKILIRKTGLGIKACIDYASTYISQTVYSCNYNNLYNDVPLEYYLGVLNSRIIYYYYLKKYGENEWKSHPYITKEILFSLPIKAVTKDNSIICEQIAQMVKKLQTRYIRKLDLEIENLVANLYGISNNEMSIIVAEINKLPDLGAINHMKIRDDE